MKPICVGQDVLLSLEISLKCRAPLPWVHTGSDMVHNVLLLSFLFTGGHLHRLFYFFRKEDSVSPAVGQCDHRFYCHMDILVVKLHENFTFPEPNVML